MNESRLNRIRVSASDPLLFAIAFEENESRHSPDAVGLGNVARFVDINLEEFHICVLLRERLENGLNRLAWWTPRSSKIDNDEGAGIAGVLGELCTVMDGNDRHVGVYKRNWAVL